MSKKHKLKSPKDPANKPVSSAPHDRRTSDLLRNAQVAPVEVADPYATEPGETIIVMRSLRDDPLAAMHAAGQVDQCQYIAGRHWQKALELSEVGSVKAIDPSKEAVDGGQLADPISEPQKRAIKDLARAARALGMEGEAIIRDVLGAGLTIAKAADRRGLKDDVGRRYLGKRFREGLDTLAFQFGYSTTQFRGTVA